jgi:hypothetical protein
MVHVAGLEQEQAAELLLRFGVGTVGRRDVVVLPVQGQRGVRRLEPFAS